MSIQHERERDISANVSKVSWQYWHGFDEVQKETVKCLRRRGYTFPSAVLLVRVKGGEF